MHLCICLWLTGTQTCNFDLYFLNMFSIIKKKPQEKVNIFIAVDPQKEKNIYNRNIRRFNLVAGQCCGRKPSLKVISWYQWVLISRSVWLASSPPLYHIQAHAADRRAGPNTSRDVNFAGSVLVFLFFYFFFCMFILLISLQQINRNFFSF